MGTIRKLADLKIGENILTYDGVNNKFAYSEVIMFLDWDPEENRDFLQLELASGKTLTVTPSHLLLTIKANISRTIYAEQLKIGDYLLVRDTNELVVNDTLVNVRSVLKRGVYAPLTTTGTVVVDDVVASCYAIIDSQTIAHWAFAPVRFVSNARDSMNLIWNYVRHPVNSLSEYKAKTTTNPKVGVHWYPKMLYTIANYLLSSHMHQ